MRAILQLLEAESEEARDVKKYIDCALLYKAADKELADMYAYLAKAEMEHFSKLHMQAERLILAKRASSPDTMDELYKWQHEHGASKIAELKQLVESYK